MMGKIRKAQDSWLAKTILFLTALSFMSLFGVSSYVGSAGKNKPVIKVDGLEVLQSDLAAQVDKQLTMAKSFVDEEYLEAIKPNIIFQTINKNLTDLIVKRTAQKLGMSISDDLVRRYIFNKAEFMDDMGRFDVNKMRRILATYGMSEREYIEQTKLDIIKEHLIATPIENMEVPEIMAEYAAKMMKQKRVFKYIVLDAKKVKIDRKISEDELEQYYEDFIVDFTNPEKREADFIFISYKDIADTIKVSDEDIQEYYKNNIDRFETPEQRNIKQISFESEDEAQNALQSIKSGKKKFDDVAVYYAEKHINSEGNSVWVSSGFLSKDLLAEEIAEPAFAAKKNSMLDLIEFNSTWNIVRVEDIKKAEKMDERKAKEEIKKELQQEGMFDEIQKTIRSVDDKVGEGLNLVEIADFVNSKVQNAKNITEAGEPVEVNNMFRDVVKDFTFVDTAFSYNIDEVSQVVELNDGLLILEVKNIVEASAKDMNSVKPQIVKIWEENERNAIVQEIINDVTNDIESGDDIKEVAKRFALDFKVTKPLGRTETFEDIAEQAIARLFRENYNTPKVVDLDTKKIIVISEKDSGKIDVSERDIMNAKMALRMGMIQEYSLHVLNSFAKDYNIKVDYKLVGFE